MIGNAAAHLYPPPSFDNPPPDVRLVQAAFVRGRQFGVDVRKFGKPYVFARYQIDALWVLYAGPFASESLAEAWISRL